jgi:hypothetical protein
MFFYAVCVHCIIDILDDLREEQMMILLPHLPFNIQQSSFFAKHPALLPLPCFAFSASLLELEEGNKGKPLTGFRLKTKNENWNKKRKGGK